VRAGLYPAATGHDETKAPSGPQWLHEIKYDGYRVQVHLNGGRKRVFTRNGLDWTKRFSVIAGALDLSGQAIIDGEVVVITDGSTNLSEVQAELAAGHQDRPVFYAFDLLYLNGFDLRGVRQVDRKREGHSGRVCLKDSSGGNTCIEIQRLDAVISTGRTRSRRM
jgi:ATP-dependent DNA ligase